MGGDVVDHTRDLMIFVEVGDFAAARTATRLIEEGQWHDLGKGWRARSDGPHVNGMKPHTHLYLKGDEVFVINKDGTPSHGSDLTKMPSKVRKALKTKMLIESASAIRSVLIPPAVIEAALKDWDHQRTMQLAQRILSRR
jgi:hypothetical protein